MVNLEQSNQSEIISSDGKINYGRFHRPFINSNIYDAKIYPKIKQKFLGKWRYKHWFYFSINSPEVFCALALINISYLKKYFFYIIEKQENKKWEIGEQKSFGNNIILGDNIISSQSFWQEKIKIISGPFNQSQSHGHKISLNLNNKDFKVSSELHLVSKELGLSLVHPLNHNRPAHTYKESANTVYGYINLNDRIFNLKEEVTLGAFDWTQTWAQRKTNWLWSSLSCWDSTHQVRIGLNLSAFVYENKKNEGQENVIWINQNCYILENAKFIVPKYLEHEKWIINSQGFASMQNKKIPYKIDLEFIPQGFRRENEDYLIIKADFVQPYGFYNGIIMVGDMRYEVKDAFGVVEKQNALW